MSTSRFDLDALRAGGAVALVFAIPFAVAARVVAESGDGNDGAAVALSLGALCGFVLGGGVAAWRQRLQAPLSHGVVAAVATYVAAQVVFIAVRLVMGDDVRWMAALFTLTTTSVAGLAGGYLGQALLRRGVAPPERRGR